MYCTSSSLTKRELDSMNPVVFDNECSFYFNDGHPLSVCVVCLIQVCVFLAVVCTDIRILEVDPNDIWQDVVIVFSCLYICDASKNCRRSPPAETHR